MLQALQLPGGMPSADLLDMIPSFVSDLENSYALNYVIFLQMTPLQAEPLINRQGRLNSLRDAAMTEIITRTTDAQSGIEYTTRAIFNNNDLLIISSEFSIILTFFVGLSLIAGSVMLNNLAENLVIKPIEVRED
jgi:hypothetical protein